MNHPEIFILSILFFASHYTRVLTTLWYTNTQGKHYSSPAMDSKIAWAKRQSDFRLFIFAILYCFVFLNLFLYYFDYLESTAEGKDKRFLHWFNKALFAFLLTIAGPGFGRALSSFLSLQFMERHPDQISGKIRWSSLYLIKSGQYQIVGLIPTLGVFAFFLPAPHAVGIFLSIIAQILYHLCWTPWAIRTDKTALQKGMEYPTEPPAPPPVQ